MMNPSQPIVLTVDDSLLMQELVKRALNQTYKVLVASNAVDALAILNNKPVAALLLDVSMPEVNGLDLCRTIRSMPQFAKLPIIMLTAKDSSFDRVQGRLSGATEYLTKPFDQAKLCQVVGQFVRAVGPSVEPSVEPSVGPT